MGQERGRRPGMVDVARRAGVSHQTVSRVLNEPASVRPATRERVLAAIEELGYRRNMAARALVTDPSRMIGVMTAFSHFYGPASTTAAIELAARWSNYGTLVTSLQVGDEEEIDEALGFLVNRGVDGLIAVAPSTGIARAAGRGAGGVPMVVVADGFAPSERVHVVSVDQGLGAGMAVRHLVGRGRRRIAHIAGPGDWGPESGYRAGVELLTGRAGQAPDAVFCANDLMALGLLAAARDLGVDVPGDLAVVGYDDMAGAGFFSPPLTTLGQPFDELGRLCLEALLEGLGGAAGRSHSISPTLRVRRSSG